MARKQSVCKECGEKFTDYWAAPGPNARRTPLCGKARCNKASIEREIKTIMKDTSNDIWYDVWGDSIPSKAEFVDVIIDRSCHDFNTEQREYWNKMSARAKRILVLGVM